MIDFSKNFIQIAGVHDKEEADLLIECGVNYIGFPLRLDYHSEDLTEAQAAALIKSFVPPVYGVLITYLNTANEINEFCNSLGAKIVQLHAPVEVKELQKLKRLNSRLKIIKSLIVRENNIEELLESLKIFEPYIDAFITDTFDPSTGASGATGKTHDWAVSRRLVEISAKPIILAGGLNPVNVKNSILKVNPAGVDSHTGVEDNDGRKTKELVKKFVDESVEGFVSIK